MATGMIGLCGQCVINLVIVEKDQELDYVTTPLRNLVETTAMASPWRQVYAMNRTAKVHYYCNKYCNSILIDQHTHTHPHTHTHIYIYKYIYIYIHM